MKPELGTKDLFEFAGRQGCSGQDGAWVLEVLGWLWSPGTLGVLSWASPGAPGPGTARQERSVQNRQKGKGSIPNHSRAGAALKGSPQDGFCTGNSFVRVLSLLHLRGWAGFADRCVPAVESKIGMIDLPEESLGHDPAWVGLGIAAQGTTALGAAVEIRDRVLNSEAAVTGQRQ